MNDTSHTVPMHYLALNIVVLFFIIDQNHILLGFHSTAEV